MAATPESSPGKADTKLFSPSVFLDLPPTPHPPERDGEESPAQAAPSDDLVLPFISRMLMEDDIDGHHCPDHPALLQIQQPYAQILSDSAAAAAAACSNSAATNANGNDADTLSPSSGAAEFANATWPYDPARLSRVLLSTASPDMGVGLGDDITTDDVNQLFLPQQEGTTVGFHQNRVTMDMLNLAFLRGIEAKKFLPTDNNLLVSRARKDEEVDGMLLLQGIGNGGGRKNRRNWDGLQAEMGRNNKLMVPEPEETGAMVDEIIINDYRLCINEMQGLSITTGSEDEKNTRKGNGKPAQGKQSSLVAVDLRTLLIHCAQAVSMDDRHSATELLGRIKLHSSPRGDSNQRLAHCFAEGLEARLAGTGSQVYIQVAHGKAHPARGAMFDMLDATIPQDSDHRLMLERVFFGRSALNVIACEGLDRVERLETYKQWQMRNHRAGLRQLPLDPDIVKVIRKNVKDRYHKDFVIDVDHRWLLEGWKGRILCAMSIWVSDDAISKYSSVPGN